MAEKRDRLDVTWGFLLAVVIEIVGNRQTATYSDR
jgi:hypothetical protein